MLSGPPFLHVLNTFARGGTPILGKDSILLSPLGRPIEVYELNIPRTCRDYMAKCNGYDFSVTKPRSTLNTDWGRSNVQTSDMMSSQLYGKTEKQRNDPINCVSSDHPDALQTAISCSTTGQLSSGRLSYLNCVSGFRERWISLLGLVRNGTDPF